jgi:PmbA protein
VYEGEVEHFVSAQSEGIGIRVIRDGRTGTSYAGTLDPSVIADVLAEARDNLGYAEVDEWAGLAEPDGVAVTPQELWNVGLETTSTATKIELAKELERLTLGLDRRVRRRRQLRRLVRRSGGRHVDRNSRRWSRERLLRQCRHVGRRR